MPIPEDWRSIEPAWCPGCGNFGILRAFTNALRDLGMKPEEMVVVSGIGQAAKFPHYLKCNAFNGLHGRTLPVATGLKLANPELQVLVTTGDGDCYGEGGNHFIHALRRNVGVKVFVHDNQIYGLTKGQASPTSDVGMVTKNQPFGVLIEPINPLALAIALQCNFVARSFAGDLDHLADMVKQAIRHPGLTLVDILQPCVTFNHLNTFKWYGERVYQLGDDYDPTDQQAAFARSMEWGDRIPIGVLYKSDRASLEDIHPVLKAGPLIQQETDFRAKVQETLKALF